jgi:hypothetical protein
MSPRAGVANRCSTCRDRPHTQVLRNEGHLRTRSGALQLRFAEEPVLVPADLVFLSASGQAEAAEVPPQAFASGDVLFYRGVPHYGAMATVIGSTLDGETSALPILLWHLWVSSIACAELLSYPIVRRRISFPSCAHMEPGAAQERSDRAMPVQPSTTCGCARAA